MNTRKLFALVLAVVMLLTLFVACGEKEKDADKNPSPSSNPSTPAGDGDTSPDFDPDDLTEVSVWLPDLGDAGGGDKADLVHDAINAITEKELGITVKFVWLALPDMPTQFSLAAANRESVDIVVTTPMPSGSFLTYYATGMASDITSLLDEHGQGIVDLMSEQKLLEAFRMNDGAIYGIPTYRNLNTNLYIVFREDALENAGVLDLARSMTTWAEYEEVLAGIKEKGEIWGVGGAQTLQSQPYVFGTGSFSDTYVYDNLGDGLGFVYTDQSGNVYNNYEIEEVLAEYKAFKSWYDNGYVYPDTAYQTEMGLLLMKQQTAAGTIMQGEFGSTSFDQIGVPVLSIKLSAGMLSTASCNKFAVIIPSVSAQPEAAMKLLNAIYTRKDLMDLFAWGVEGETYIVDELGYATFEEGKDSSTCGYHSSDYVFGNQFIATPWTLGVDITGEEMRSLTYDDFAGAASSVYMGITVDTGEYGALVSALAAVRDEYVPQLTSGMYSDAIYNEFIKKLNATGVEEYLAVFRTAVDEFMA